MTGSTVYPEDRTGALRWGVILSAMLLIFTVSWGVMYVQGWVLESRGPAGNGGAPLGMFIPALVVILYRRVFLRESPIHAAVYRESPRWIVDGFIVLVVIQAVVTALAYANQLPSALSRGILSWSMILWTLLLIKLYRRHGEASFQRAGLQLGNTDLGARFVVGFVLFLALQSALNLLFGLSRLNLPPFEFAGFTATGGVYPLVWLLLLFLAAVGTPLGALALTFGEEYAWRGFLQDELAPLGRLPSSALIGLIWGVWHIPIILTGQHTYAPTAPGFFLAAVFFTLWGVIQSYAVIQTGSVWAAVFLHGVVNGVYGFFRATLERPADKVLSFGLGAYGLVCLAVVVLLILRDPVWSERVDRAPLKGRAPS